MARSKKKPRKLTDKDWDLIRRLYETDGMSNYRIADEYNITEGAIRGRAKRGDWKRMGVTPLQIAEAALEGHEAPRSQSTNLPQSDSGPPIAHGDERSGGEGGAGVDLEGRPARTDRANFERGERRKEKVHIDCLDRADLPHLRRESLSNEDAMLMGIQNAQDLMTLIGSEVRNLTERSGDFGEEDVFPVDSKRINDLATANGKAIEQIRKIRGMDRELPDEIEALQVLVEASWLPMELLVEAMKRFQSLKPALQRDFREHYALSDLQADAAIAASEVEA